MFLIFGATEDNNAYQNGRFGSVVRNCDPLPCVREIGPQHAEPSLAFRVGGPRLLLTGGARPIAVISITAGCRSSGD